MLLAVFTPSQDNTLFESGTGATSSGEGPSLFAGRSRLGSDALRRAALAFDLSGIPAGSTITSVRLDLVVTRNPFGSLVNHDFTVHTLSRSWGEGESATAADGGGLGVDSSPGDATWQHAFFDTDPWSTPGGDFEATASAIASVGNEDAIASWSSAELVADVQAWIDAPETNFGWLVLGQEGTAGTARRFSSREGTTPPVLDVTFVEQTLPDVTLSVEDSTISETGGVATFTAALSAASDSPVTIELEFGGTASTTDYAASSSQIVILPGATSGSIIVSATPDAIDEQDETVVVDIGTVTGGTELGVQQQTLTITDDDDPPVPDVSLTVDKEVIPESGGVATVTAVLSQATTVPVTVSLVFGGTAVGSDYVASSASIVVSPGDTLGSVTVVAADDTDDEVDETVVVAISAVLGGNALGVQEVTTTIADDDDPAGLIIVSLTPTGSGFVAEFNQELDIEGLNLYDAPNTGFGGTDVVVEGVDGGRVTGSLVVDPSSRRIEFIKTGDPLPADDYTVTIRSGADAFRNLGGQLLDGNGDGAGGDDFVSEFTVEAPPPDAITIGISDFVRGPGQPVNLPADSSSGLPLFVSAGTNVRAIDARISYDPGLLEITGATVGAAAPAGATVVLNNSTPGLAILVYFSSESLPESGGIFVNLEASVPVDNASNIYRSSQVLDIHGVTITDGNDNEFAFADDDGFHLATYLGDTSANGRINASDAAQLAQFAALIGTGFAGLPNADPQIVGDVSRNGRLNALDASLVARFSALISVPEIPAIPGGVPATAERGFVSRHLEILPGEVETSPWPASPPSRWGMGDEVSRLSGSTAEWVHVDLGSDLGSRVPIAVAAELPTQDLEDAVDELLQSWPSA